MMESQNRKRAPAWTEREWPVKLTPGLPEQLGQPGASCTSRCLSCPRQLVPGTVQEQRSESSSGIPLRPPLRAAAVTRATTTHPEQQQQRWGSRLSPPGAAAGPQTAPTHPGAEAGHWASPPGAAVSAKVHLPST
ncbi:hypothetical protein UY3_05471 [Chelonia mydas]|uniref:Uncharacterized protein n=1 Tax=Chelonia mydas TaxID=8469 RepID=M7BHI4_CHEMY|nr:hypothetical protein UY3_05471 [Chelonia mydas]